MAVSGKGSIFHQAVSSVFKEWQALRIAVDNMFGGPMSREKALWLEEITADFVSNNANVDKWEVEEYISTVMDQEFNTQVDDASLPEIAQKILHLYSLCINGNTTQVEEYIGQSEPAKTIETQCLSQESTEEDDEDSGEEEMEEDAGLEEETKEDIKDEDIIRIRLDQVHINQPIASTSQPIANTSQHDITVIPTTLQEHDKVTQTMEECDEEGEWEVVKKGKRKSRSKQKQ